MTATTTPPTLATQLAALEALTVLGRTHAHLPAVNLAVSTVYADTIRMHIHDDLGVFETWREALGIPADSVTHHAYDGRLTLKATTTFHSATIEVTAYADALPGVAS